MPPQSSPPRAVRLPAAVALGAVLLLAAGALLQRAAADMMLRRDAEMAAGRWAAALPALVPGLPALLRGDADAAGAAAAAAAAPDAARALLGHARGAGGVVGFRLLDRGGAPVLDVQAPPAAGDGDGGGGARLATAWAELRDGAGEVVGIAEFVLDQAERRSLYARAALLVELGVAALVLPTALAVAVVLRRRGRAGRDAEARLRHLARHDPLTGLANREHLHDRLGADLAAAQREGSTVAVLVVDLDRFKEVNEGLGPAAGDALLREAAERLSGAVRQHDLVARLGADEFAVVQRGLRGAADPLRLAERLSERLREPYALGAAQAVLVGATIGFAVGPRDGLDPAVLLRRADTALGRAKAEARGGWRGFQPGMDAALQARRRTERELGAALDAGALALHYQPLHALPGRERVGWEALLRWPHPERGLVSPAEFIPLAEETGLIVPLGAWALRTACRDAARWPDGERLAVNLSPAQFRQGDIVGTVRAAVRDSGLAPSRLELEITEGLLLHNTEGVLRQLDALRALGVRIVMDDFGTGYSSLGYLWRFPFDKLKIDRSFVRDLESDRRAVAIVCTIIGLGRALRIPVTAEGVETEAQMRALADAGCDQVQGFLLGRPAPLAALEAERAAGVGRLRAAAE